MSSRFTEGEVIRRKDRTPFPDGRFWAIVRKPEKLYDPWNRVWIIGGQWIGEDEVEYVTRAEVNEQAWVGSDSKPIPQANPDGNWEMRYKEELKSRRRHQKRAVKANNTIDPMKQELAKAKKEIAQLQGIRRYQNVRDAENEAAASKLDLIKGIIDGTYHLPGSAQ